MEQLPSRAWSCQTLQRGVNLASQLSMTLSACAEPDVEAMRRELAELEAILVLK